MLSFNGDISRIILDTPKISLHEQADQSSRGPKPRICKELLPKDYRTFSEIMRDAERVESAQRQGTFSKVQMQRPAFPVDIPGPVPTEIGTFELKKLTKEDGERHMCEWLCVLCPQEEYLASNRLKARQN